MIINSTIIDGKLRYDIKGEAAKISELLSGKTDKYKYITGEEILPSNQRQIIEPAKFTYSPLGKVFEKQTKKIEEQGRKKVDAITNQNQSLLGLNKKDNYKEILENQFNKDLMK